MSKRNGSSAWFSSDGARSDLRSIIGITLVIFLALNLRKSRNLEQTHLNWLLSHGAVAHVEIGKACRSCPRGLIAARDMKPASLILRIPEAALIKFPHIEHSAFAAVSWIFEELNSDLINPLSLQIRFLKIISAATNDNLTPSFTSFSAPFSRSMLEISCTERIQIHLLTSHMHRI